MSDVTPNPNGEVPENEVPFDFSNLSAESLSDVGFGEPEPPNVKATKAKWWQPKNGMRNTKAAKASEPKKRGRPPGTTMTDAALRQALESFYSGIAMVAYPFCSHCAESVGNSAEEAAEAMVEWSKTNPAIRRFLVNMVSISAGGKVLAIHSAMLMPIAMHHVPSLQRKQEQMVSGFAENLAKMAAEQRENGES